jgi:two-component system alkaline phosphatase synthesis response regulator PhoP
MTTILVVDDDTATLRLIQTFLAREGYTIHLASNSEDAVRLARGVHPDLIILDLMLPGLAERWETYRRLREDSDVPIIMLAAGADEVDRVVGLELGADDYVSKPFNPRELVARVKAVLRRFNTNHVSHGVLAVADVRLDPDRYEVTVAGQPVALPPKEFKLLAVLARTPGIVVPRARLVQLVWPERQAYKSRALDVHISWLRQKLRGSSVRIERAWGVGYRLVAPSETGPVTPSADLTRA